MSHPQCPVRVIFRVCSAALVTGPLVAASGPAAASGGPIGIDHLVTYDNSGIWNRSYQNGLEYGLIAVEVAGALWEGADTRLGKTFWQSVDASVIGGLSSTALKYVFTRPRPSQDPDPDEFFAGQGHYSFPSGEVTLAASVVTPFVLEYGPEQPWVYGLEAIPIYDAIARVKVHGHWQSDVLAGWALGTATGWYAHSRQTPFMVEALPDGVSVGFKKRF